MSVGSFRQVTSPNFNARDPAVPLEYIVLHYTGMPTAQAALDRLCDPKAQVSAHFLIDEDGAVTQLVDEAQRAWHAGISYWRGQRDMNSASVGIELVNPGHEFGYRPFPAAQISACLQLVQDIAARHGMDPRACLLGHSDIAPTRKQDPGELFPWDDFAKAGFELWPIAASLPQTPDEAILLMNAIGYDISNAAAACRAFQRRFRFLALFGDTDPGAVLCQPSRSDNWTSAD